MEFLAPWSLAGLVLVPAVLLWGLLAPRGRPVVVGSLMLWRRVLGTGAAGRPSARLRLRDPLLWLDAAALLLVILACARPAVRTARPMDPVATVVIDRTASMATASAGPRGRRWQDAQAAVAAILREVGDVPVRVVSVPGPDGETVAETMTSAALASGGGAAWEPLLVAADVWPVAAAEAARQGAASVRAPDGPVIVATDVAPPSATAGNVYVLAAGGTSGNVGLSRAATRVEGDRVWILVQARASDGARGPYGLRVSAASGETLAERPDFLAPGRTAEVVLPMSGPAPGRLGVALVGPDDGFPADNQAWLALEPRRRVTVMLLGPVDPSLRRALAARAGTTVIEAPPGAAPAEGVDLVVAQATALPDGWTGPAAVVGPGGAVGPVRPRAEPGPAAQWRVAEGHPLAAAFYLEPPRLSVAATYAADASAQLLLGTADAPLMVTWGGDGRRRLAVLFDLAEPATDWPRRAGFPIFWSRAVDWLVPGDERRAELRTYRPFEPVPGRNRLAPSRVGFQEGGGEVFGVSFIGTDEGFQAGPGRDDSRAAVEAVRASVAARREATLAAAWPFPAALALLALLARARVAR